MTPAPTGSLAALLRYPVKSMAGEALTQARVLADHGVQGDRTFALLDVATGQIASAKHPRRWGALLEWRARCTDEHQRRGPVAIVGPDGIAMRSDLDDVDERLSRVLGRAVRLVATPPPQATYDQVRPGEHVAHREPLAVGADTGTFFDFAPIHLITTASLAHLQRLAPAVDFDVARFRPNLVIDTGSDGGFVEHGWLGQVIAIGDEVRLCVTFPCPRCVMTTLAQGPLAADAGVLRTLAAHNQQMFALLARKVAALGVYATVVRGGTIRRGDPVRLEGRAPLRRIAAFVHAVKRAVRRR